MLIQPTRPDAFAGLMTSIDPLDAGRARAARRRRGRALHVITRYLRGGSEARLRDIVDALPELDHTILVGVESDLQRAATALPSADVHLLSSLRRQVAPAADLSTVRRLMRELRSGDYDVVFSHQSKAATVVRTAAALVSGPPVVHSLSMASFGPGYGRTTNIAFRAIERLLARHTARFVAVGEDLVRRYTSIGIDRDRFGVVRSGTRLPTRRIGRDEAAAELGIATDRPIVAYVGSLEPRKGVRHLPALLDRVASNAARPPRLVVAGEGPEEAALRTEAERRGLGHDSVQLLGHLDDVTPLLWAADVLVLLSNAEGLSQVLLQAAATGLPFVSYDVDGVGELLAMGAVGAAVPIGSLSVAAAAVEELIASGREEPKIDVSSWDPGTIRAGYRAVVAEVLAGAAAPSATEVLP